MQKATTTVESSYWRHAVVAAAVFAVPLSWGAEGLLVGTFLVQLAVVAFAAIPHVRGREASGFHRSVRRFLAWLTTVGVGLNITALVLGIPILLLMGRGFAWSILVGGLASLGYLIFTAHLLRAPVNTSRPLTILDLQLPVESRRMLLQLQTTLKAVGYSTAEVDGVLGNPNIQGVASLAGVLSAYPFPLDTAESREAVRKLVADLVVSPTTTTPAATQASQSVAHNERPMDDWCSCGRFECEGGKLCRAPVADSAPSLTAQSKQMPPGLFLAKP